MRALLAKISSLRLPNVSLHPLFLAYLALLFFCGAGETVLLALGVVLLHEAGHFAVAAKLGARLGEIVLYPFGAVMIEEYEAPRGGEWKIALAGPAANFLIAAVSGIILIAGGKTASGVAFLNANVCVAVFNLLPVYPLDGGRAILSVSAKPVSTLKFLRASGIVCAAILFVAFLFTMLGTVNFSLGVLSIFLLSGAMTGTEKEMSARAAATLLVKSKPYLRGVPVMVTAYSENTPVYKIVPKLSRSKITDLKIIFKDGKSLSISEKDFLRFAESVPPTTPLGAILTQTNRVYSRS